MHRAECYLDEISVKELETHRPDSPLFRAEGGMRRIEMELEVILIFFIYMIISICTCGFLL